tara:strand:- start:951 stop:1853 length:903 start_codon:yes stop_codon:yes gene_type:complete
MATVNITVTVGAYTEGNRFKFNGAKTPNQFFIKGNTYVFDVSDSSNSGHPLKFSTTQHGTHNSGAEYTTGVTVSGTAGTSGATVTWVVPSTAAATMYYYCGNHNNMAGNAVIRISGVSLTNHAVDSFTTSTTIFANSLAREIPTKVESIATAFKTHMNTELNDITTYTNASWDSVTGDSALFNSQVAEEQTNFEGRFETNFANLQTNLANYIGTGTSYTKTDVDTTLFTGTVPAADIVYNSDGRLTKIKGNGKTIYNIAYDSSGYIQSFVEQVDIGGITQTKNHTVSVDSNGNITQIVAT